MVILTCMDLTLEEELHGTLASSDVKGWNIPPLQRRANRLHILGYSRVVFTKIFIPVDKFPISMLQAQIKRGDTVHSKFKILGLYGLRIPQTNLTVSGCSFVSSCPSVSQHFSGFLPQCQQLCSWAGLPSSLANCSWKSGSPHSHHWTSAIYPHLQPPQGSSPLHPPSQNCKTPKLRVKASFLA